eukprot:2947175-Rhodomonas_salina.3
MHACLSCPQFLPRHAETRTRMLLHPTTTQNETNQNLHAPSSQTPRERKRRQKHPPTDNTGQVGTEGPAVVLLHGFGGGLALWAQNLRGLASSYTVYALDLPGHAGSSAPPKTSATLAKDLAKDLANDLLPDALSEKLALDPAERAEKCVMPQSSRSCCLMRCFGQVLDDTDADADEEEEG